MEVVSVRLFHFHPGRLVQSRLTRTVSRQFRGSRGLVVFFRRFIKDTKGQESGVLPTFSVPTSLEFVRSSELSTYLTFVFRSPLVPVELLWSFLSSDTGLRLSSVVFICS